MTDILFFISFLGVKGYYIDSEKAKLFLDDKFNFMIEKNIINTPELTITEYNIQSDVFLKPAFDIIWNACGFKGSLNYNKDGRWEE